ncbi:hypothetical protein BH11PSE11_BH11PSE11_23500 [soil metagenome]
MAKCPYASQEIYALYEAKLAQGIKSTLRLVRQWHLSDCLRQNQSALSIRYF